MSLKFKKLIFAFLIIFASPVVAHAFGLELRGNFGGTFVDPGGMNLFLRNNGIKEVYVYGNVGGDIIIFPIIVPIGVGARYEYNGVKVDAINKGAINEGELQAAKWSALLTARIVQPAFYGGLIFTLGVDHKSTFTLRTPSGKRTYNDNQVNTTYSIGFDSGFKIFNIRLGSEAGYQSYVIKEVKGSAAGNSGISIDLNGFYAMIHIGVGF
ncbi:MAG: hypothetical protein SGI74_04170 [Oligoflexia bacterium]|nr:hypothetical protein [Oligoflexia bacterium]